MKLPHKLVGKCVYCGASEGKLTNEHILAAALGGETMLLKGSCEICQRIINEQIENPLFHKIWRGLRYRDGIGSRDVRKRPATMPVRVGDTDSITQEAFNAPNSSTVSTVLHPTDDHIAFLALPVLTEPGYLTMIDKCYFLPSMVVNVFVCLMNGSRTPPEGKSFMVESYYDSKIIFRFLAKTAHCVAVYNYGLNGFNSFLKEFILGKDERAIGMFIGGSPQASSVEVISMRVEVRLVNRQSGMHTVLASIRLFGDFGAPTYSIVVGQMNQSV